MERKNVWQVSREHQFMIARRTCTEVDPELKQVCGKMEEEVCEKNNMELSERECYFGRGEKTARGKLPLSDDGTDEIRGGHG